MAGTPMYMRGLITFAPPFAILEGGANVIHIERQKIERLVLHLPENKKSL